MKTRAAVLEETAKPLLFEELLIPELAAGQVLVRLSYSGLCHSQLNEIRGFKGKDAFLPHTLGHEGSGIVEAVGPGVSKVSAGDSVVLTWIVSSGQNVPSCKYKRANGQDVNSGAVSTFLERAVVSENRLVAIPSAMPLKAAALFGCALPTGAGIVLNTLKVKRGETVAIFGAGGIGLSALLAASLAEAGLIVVFDFSAYRLDLAKRLGASHVVDLNSSEVSRAVNELTAGRGFDYAIEAAGKKEAMEAAFSVCREKGGLAVLAGNLKQGERISLDPFELIKGKRLAGSWGGESRPDDDIPKYVKGYLDGKLPLDGLITHVYKLDQLNQAFLDLEHHKVGRALVEF